MLLTNFKQRNCKVMLIVDNKKILVALEEVKIPKIEI